MSISDPSLNENLPFNGVQTAQFFLWEKTKMGALHPHQQGQTSSRSRVSERGPGRTQAASAWLFAGQLLESWPRTLKSRVMAEIS